MYSKIYKIDNSEKSSVKEGLWKKPGAKFYNALLKSYENWEELIDEAYAVHGKINNTPYGVTPFANSGCKYPHHVLKKGKLVVSIPGLKAAYSRARQQGTYRGSLKRHLDKHFKELGMMDAYGVHYESKIESNFIDIENVVMQHTNVDLTEDINNSKLLIESYNESPESPLVESVDEADRVSSKPFYGINTPKELMNSMRKILYGWWDEKDNSARDIDTDKDVMDMYSRYQLQTPYETLERKIGVCWDQAELEREWFKSANIPHWVFYIEIQNGGGDYVPNHTFLVFRDKKGWYNWFEHSWGKYRGIHGYEDLQSLLHDVVTKHQKDNEDEKSPVIIRYVKTAPKYGSNPHEFLAHVRNEPAIDFKNLPVTDDQITPNSIAEAFEWMDGVVKYNDWGNLFTDFEEHRITECLGRPEIPVTDVPEFNEDAKNKFIDEFFRLERELNPLFDDKLYEDAKVMLPIGSDKESILEGLYLLERNTKLFIKALSIVGRNPDICPDGWDRDSTNVIINRYCENLKEIQNDIDAVEHGNYDESIMDKYAESASTDIDFKIIKDANGNEYKVAEHNRTLVGVIINNPDLIIPKEVRVLTGGVFDKSDKIKSVKINHKMKIRHAFKDCKSLQKVEIEYTKNIGESTFEGCTSLKSVKLPETLSAIKDSAFSGCKTLQSIDIPNSVKEIGASAFSNCDTLESITIPANTDSISSNAFSGCTSLKEVKLSDTLKYIDDGAFYRCTSLKEIAIPNSVKIIGTMAFYGCTSLKSITLPSSMKVIHDRTFKHCTNLHDVIIPNSVTKIEKDAFSKCINLSETTKKRIFEIDNDYRLESLETRKYGKLLTEKSHGLLKYCYRVGFDADTGEQVAVRFDLEPDKVTAIGDQNVTRDAINTVDPKAIDRPDYEAKIKSIHSKALEKIKSNNALRKYGYIDFVTGPLKVSAIFTKSDLANNKKAINLKKVRLIPMLSPLVYFNIRKAHRTYPELNGLDPEDISAQDIFNLQRWKNDIIRDGKYQAEEYEVGQVSGADTYKTTALLWDTDVFHAYKYTPVLRGYNTMPNPPKASVEKISKYIDNNLYTKYKHEPKEVVNNESTMSLKETIDLLDSMMTIIGPVTDRVYRFNFLSEMVEYRLGLRPTFQDGDMALWPLDKLYFHAIEEANHIDLGVDRDDEDTEVFTEKILSIGDKEEEPVEDQTEEKEDEEVDDNAAEELSDILDEEIPEEDEKSDTDTEEEETPTEEDEDTEEDAKSTETSEEPHKDEEPKEEESKPKEEKPISRPKQVDRNESDKNGVRRKKLYIAFIEWCKEFNRKNVFGSNFDKDIFHVTFPFVPEEMRYFYRLANPTMCVLSGDLTFFPLADLRKINQDNNEFPKYIIFAATENDLRVFNTEDKMVYLATEENGDITLSTKLGDTFDLYIQNMIKRGDILNAPLDKESHDEAPESDNER